MGLHRSSRQDRSSRCLPTLYLEKLESRQLLTATVREMLPAIEAADIDMFDRSHLAMMESAGHYRSGQATHPTVTEVLSSVETNSPRLSMPFVPTSQQVVSYDGDHVGRGERTENTRVKHTAVTEGVGPDLRAFFFDADFGGDDLVTAGDTLTLFYDYDNIGDAAVLGDAYDIGFYLSLDQTVDAGDEFLNFLDGVDLAGGGDFEQGTTTVTLPAASDPFWIGNGPYYIVMYVDDLDGVFETNELNNQLADDLNIGGTGVPTPDLRALYFDADFGGDDLVTAGDTLTLLYDYDNIGDAAVLGDAYDIGFYLSLDQTVDAGDEFLDFLDGVDLAGGGDFEQGTTTVTLPAASDPFWIGNGPYYIVMYVDDLEGVFELEFNNQLADDLNIGGTGVPTPDLRAFNFDADFGGDDLVTAGDTLTLFYDYDNIGDAAVLGDAYDIGFYLSLDQTVDAGDEFLDFLDGVDLAGGGDFEQGFTTVTLPAASDPFWIGNGPYYIVMYVDDLEGVFELEFNNQLADDLNIGGTGVPTPDLRAFNFDADFGGDDLVTAGDTLTLFYDYDNIGDAAVLGDAYDIGFYLSLDQTVDAGDELLKFLNGVDLAGGGDFEQGFTTVTLPAVSDPFWIGNGTYYIVMYVDDLDGVFELDFNNQLADDLQVTVPAVPDGDFNDDTLYNCLDIDALVEQIVSGANNAAYDLTGDGLVNLMDRDAWLAEAATALGYGSPIKLGDANLDGNVDGQDFIVWNANKFTNVAAWCRGDFTANGTVDGQDFIAWNFNKFTSSDAGAGRISTLTDGRRNVAFTDLQVEDSAVEGHSIAQTTATDPVRNERPLEHRSRSISLRHVEKSTRHNRLAADEMFAQMSQAEQSSDVLPVQVRDSHARALAAR